MKSRKPFLLRISPELFAELEAWADQELRSVNGQIEWVLKEAVQRRKRESKEIDANETDNPRQSE